MSNRRKGDNERAVLEPDRYPDRSLIKHFSAPLEALSVRTGTGMSRVLQAWFLISACASGRREDEYMEAIAKWKPDDLADFSRAYAYLIEALTEQPFTDFLGILYQDYSHERERRDKGEFYTPKNVAVLMAELTLTARGVKDPLYMAEPACGSGVMVLATAHVALERHGLPPSALRVEAWDLNRVACDMAYLNFSLCGIPARVVHGNSLTKQVHAAWHTPHVRLEKAA